MDVKSRPQHRRNPSSKSGILRALVSSKSRPASPENSPTTADCREQDHPSDAVRSTSRGVLGERQGNVQSPPASPSKKHTALPQRTKGEKFSKVPTKTTDGKNSPKKSKSSSNLAAAFAKMNRSSKDLSAHAQKEKENTTPPMSASGPPETPIWAQFASPREASQRSHEDRRPKSSSDLLQDEIAKYTPKAYMPSTQRNFNGSFDKPGVRPTLCRDRPKGDVLVGSQSFIGMIGRRVSGASSIEERRMSEDTKKKDLPIQNGKVSTEKSRFMQRSTTDRKTSGSSTEQQSEKEKLNITKRGGRVMAAVAAFQGKGKEAPAVQKKEEPLDPKTVDAAFEVMLESRNIPEPMRQKMRGLTLRMKVDFITNDQGSKESPPGTSYGSLGKSHTSTNISDTQAEGKREEDKYKASKRSRTRSRTFTFTKSDKKNKSEASPAKKQRSQTKARPISIQIPTGSAHKSSHNTLLTPTGSFGRETAPAALPGDYISYLRKNQDPTKIEVGRLHKLRILLRNETVAWVDTFIFQDGMSEIVGLLHRIMAIEWREDHEDQLLHETLLCLKGICTTERALSELSNIADDLFPALLGMLFDDEKKGPAEYSTRTIVISVLFNFLASVTSVSSDALEQRARRILGYLGEPSKPEEARPADFVLAMRVPRPYKLWSREVSNVTKEVFWIFLHRLNIVPLPKPSSSHSNSDLGDAERAKVLEATYTIRHFPGSRPPVPAAPYIGGVEWDATTYMAAHLDLLNGLIASLPSAAARNLLRQELEASGFEKTMGSVLRTCKEKFYSGVHDGLRAWVAAAVEDGWEARFVREGPTDEDVKEHAMRSKSASPKKARKTDDEQVPILEAPPKLELADLKLHHQPESGEGEDDGWLG